MRDRRHLLKGAEELADFTDRLLDGKTADDTSAAADRELAQLFETVKLITRASAPQRDPEPALKNRIRANLSAMWQQDGPSVPEQRSSRQAARVLVLRYALVATAVILVAGLVIPQFETVLPGAAQSQGITIVSALVLLAILGLIYVLNIRRK